MYREEHAYRRFFNDLAAGRIAGPVLIYGKERYLSDWAVRELRKKYSDEAFGSLGYSVIDAEDLESRDLVSEIISSCETISLFSAVRLVIVRSCDKLLAGTDRNAGSDRVDALIRYIKDMPPGVILVFRADQASMKNRLPKAIRDCGAEYEMEPLERRELRSFAVKRLKENGGRIGQEALEAFIDATGYFNKDSSYDLYALAGDAGKLAALADGSEITAEMVEAVVSGDADKYIFHMLDHITAGRKDKALEYFRNIVKEEDFFRILASAISQFETMLSVKQLDARGAGVGIMQKKLGIKSDFRVKKALQQASGYSVRDLKILLSKLYQIDRMIKTGAMPAELAMELFIAGL
ncbi:MAG: DNA polymerase III subunit delta [Firmicutes bacterium]|nr:DNA polymerase III subunit delta [Eubacterium sp.]MBR3053907.1 DNA polymerase III subunit delta [Bacillota bacterium]